jgi:ketosteroid isomerase-like protein
MKLIRPVVFLAVFVTLPVAAAAQAQSDIDAIKQLLQQYRSTQDAGDLIGQGKLMTPDRVWINQAGVRRADNVENMRVQQIEADFQKKRAPGMQTVTMDRDLLIKFYGDGKVAVASFYRTAVRFFPPGTPKDIMQEYAPGGETGTLVLEKRDGAWKIVHTHWSGASS